MHFVLRIVNFFSQLEEAEWYGLTFKEAMIKQHLSEQKEILPLKLRYRKELLEQLNDSDLDELAASEGK